MHKIKYILFLAILTVFSNSRIIAQCAMCKSVVGSNKDAGGNIANGLNTGILYLMAIPYVVLFILFRKKIFGFLKELKSAGR